MTDLNSRSIPKSPPPSWLKNGRVEDGWDKYPPNPAGGKPAGKKGEEGKIAIKGGGGQERGRLRKLERRSVDNNKRKKMNRER